MFAGWLEENEQYAFLMPQWLPDRLYGRHTGWMPVPTRRARNRAVIATAVEMMFCIASLPLGAFRGGIARISTGLNVVLFGVAVLGLVGSLKASFLALFMHCALVWGVLFIFLLIFLLSTLLGGNGQEEETLILIVVFGFFVVDAIVACFTFDAARKLRAYEAQCKAEDVAAGGEGRGAALRQAQTARVMLQGIRRGEPADPTMAALSSRSHALAVVVAPTPDVRSATDADGTKAAGAPTAPVAPVPPPSPAMTDEEANRIIAQAHDAALPLASERREGAAAGAAAPGGESALGVCPVCLDRPRDAVFDDCGHAACMQCATEVRNRFGHCFLCRKRILKVLRVFV